MPDLKITELTADATPTSDDLVVTVNDPAGTPGNKKVTLANLAVGLGGAWTSYVPSWTNCTVTNSTVVAAYQQIGKTVNFRVKLTFAGGDTPSGAISVSLPVTSIATMGDGMPIARAVYTDAGAAYYPGYAQWATTTTAALFVFNAAGTYANDVNVTATAPFTFGNTDVIYITGTYEAA